MNRNLIVGAVIGALLGLALWTLLIAYFVRAFETAEKAGLFT